MLISTKAYLECLCKSSPVTVCLCEFLVSIFAFLNFKQFELCTCPLFLHHLVSALLVVATKQNHFLEWLDITLFTSSSLPFMLYFAKSFELDIFLICYFLFRIYLERFCFILFCSLLWLLPFFWVLVWVQVQPRKTQLQQEGQKHTCFKKLL